MNWNDHSRLQGQHAFLGASKYHWINYDAARIAESFVNYRECLLDPNNVICVSDRTHKAIHYGDDSILEPAFTERRPGDTCPWRKEHVPETNV